jgi:23S rRNA (pseudouridine1915-N3)-methyltransferase
MRIHLCAVGRLRSGPERALIDDYLSRFDRAGRGLALGPAAEHEVEDKRGSGPAGEGALILRTVPAGAALVALDERGAQLSSPEFARMIAAFRDEGRQDLAFAIGGADGLSAEVTGGADAVIAFGRMVWPHMLARVMLAEQLYRAGQILAGTPYHRA